MSESDRVGGWQKGLKHGGGERGGGGVAPSPISTRGWDDSRFTCPSVLPVFTADNLIRAKKATKIPQLNNDKMMLRMP